MANFEHVNDVGAWTFHSLIESSKLDRMAMNEEAIHQNKPRTCNQYESTFVVTGENAGNFLEITHLQPDHTALLFGVLVIDSDDFTGVVLAPTLLFPTGPGLGPFLRPPVISLSASAFSIADGDNGDSWQDADITAASAADGTNNWLLVSMRQPFAATNVDNYKAGISLMNRIAGFDGDAGVSPSAGRNYYIFYHAVGPVAVYL